MKTSRVCYLLWVFKTRIAITMMTNQHQHHNCEEDITMFNKIKTIAQLYTCLSILGESENFRGKFYPLTALDINTVKYIVCMYSSYCIRYGLGSTFYDGGL